jgi:hypothetical protein
MMQLPFTMPFVSMVFAALVIYGEPSAGATQTMGTPLARFTLIESGVHRYLRYRVSGFQRAPVDIWTRAVAFEVHDGKRLMHIVMRWDKVAGPSEFIEQDSWFEPATFRPLTHVMTRKLRDAAKPEIGGYRFLPDKIVGMSELPENLRKDFVIASSEAAYNFEYDMELLQALPLAEGYSVSIPFYDPGNAQTATARYTFKVAGSDRIRGPDGRWLECWLLTADYNTGKIQSRFWFDKKTQIMIREEQPQGDGSILIKTLLEPEADDSRAKP